MPPMPPAELRFNVAGIDDETQFDLLGQQSLREFGQALAAVGASIDDRTTILEWGCGCGRILRHLTIEAERQKIHGCDIDPTAIKWVQENLPFVDAVTNGEFPPLPYDSGSFDLILNHSVLSHLDEAHQDLWLTELRRILSPDGLLILTVLGPHAHRSWASSLPVDRPDLDRAIAESTEALASKGIYFFVDDGWAANFPSYYQSTFHQPWYVFQHWSKFFDIAAYIPHGSLNHQDMIVLRHKSPPPPPRPASHPALTSEVVALKAEIAALRNSTSWRLTEPLRSLAGVFKRGASSRS